MSGWRYPADAPKDGTTFMAVTVEDDPDGQIVFAEWDDGSYFGNGAGWITPAEWKKPIEIVAWQPLPEKPEIRWSYEVQL